MANSNMSLVAIDYNPSKPPTLQILDQLLLPHTTQYIQIKTVSDAYNAIKTMQVRGAPAIAVVGALSLAVELSALRHHSPVQFFTTARGTKQYIHETLDHLLTSRPTAVNLGNAVRDLKALTAKVAEDHPAGLDNPQKGWEGAAAVADAFVAAAEQMLSDDVRDNKAIGKYGAEWILANVPAQKVSVLTHCNTGSLATASYGTALGIVRSLHASGALSRAYYTETRPYNQGSRLTGYELAHDKIPATIIPDSAGAALLAYGAQTEAGPDKPVAVIVGADRVVRNGDTANKIGTFSLALAAKNAGAKFIVAAPRTSIDLVTPDGKGIVIEERSADELLHVSGLLVENAKPEDAKLEGPNAPPQRQPLPFLNSLDRVYNPTETSSNAPTIQQKRIAIVIPGAVGNGVWNPAFDVTPNEYIDAIVTEVGVVTRGPNGFDLEAIFNKSS